MNSAVRILMITQKVRTQSLSRSQDLCDISMLQVSIDLLSWDFSVMTVDDSNVSASPKVCCYFVLVATWPVRIC